eukprot:g312.t1
MAHAAGRSKTTKRVLEWDEEEVRHWFELSGIVGAPCDAMVKQHGINTGSKVLSTSWSKLEAFLGQIQPPVDASVVDRLAKAKADADAASAADEEELKAAAAARIASRNKIVHDIIVDLLPGLDEALSAAGSEAAGEGGGKGRNPGRGDADPRWSDSEQEDESETDDSEIGFVDALIQRDTHHGLDGDSSVTDESAPDSYEMTAEEGAGGASGGGRQASAEKVISMDEARRLLQDDDDVERLLRPENRAELCDRLASELNLVAGGGADAGDGGGVGGPLRISMTPKTSATGEQVSLKLVLLQLEPQGTEEAPKSMNTPVLGVLDMDDRTSLASLRRVIQQGSEIGSVDAALVPEAYLFVSSGRLVGRRKERKRVVKRCLPEIAIADVETLTRIRDAQASGAVDPDGEIAGVDLGQAEDLDRPWTAWSMESIQEEDQRQRGRSKRRGRNQRRASRHGGVAQGGGPGSDGRISPALSDANLSSGGSVGSGVLAAGSKEGRTRRKSQAQGSNQKVRRRKSKVGRGKRRASQLVKEGAAAGDGGGTTTDGDAPDSESAARPSRSRRKSRRPSRAGSPSSGRASSASSSKSGRASSRDGKKRRKSSVARKKNKGGRRRSRQPSFMNAKGSRKSVRGDAKKAAEAAAAAAEAAEAARKKAAAEAAVPVDLVVQEVPLSGFASASKGSVYVTTQRELVGRALNRGDEVKIGEHVVRISKEPSAPCHGTTFTLDAPYEGETHSSYLMWKLVRVESAKARRPSFMTALESSLHVDAPDLGDGDTRETFFRVTFQWRQLEPLLGVLPGLSKTVEGMVEKVPQSFVYAEVFDYLCNLKPVSAPDMLDGGKWAKFCRDCPGLIDRKLVTQTHVDIIFAKNKEKGQRRITLAQFTTALTTVAMQRYPGKGEGEAAEAAALNELMHSNVYAWDKTNNIIWKEARRMAISGEARQQCGATRLGAMFRGRIFRWRYLRACQMAELIQRTFRAYLQRTDFLHKLEKLRELEAKRREEIRQRRRARKEALLYREGRNVSGVPNVVTVYRHSKKDIFMRVYNPKTSEVFCFTLTRDDLRVFLERVLGRGGLSMNELYMKENMRALADQLVYKRQRGVKVIMLSRRGRGQRGIRLMKRGFKISGRACVVSIFKYYRDYIFTAYDVESCEVFNVGLKLAQLYKWFDYDPLDPNTPDLLLLHNEHRLLRWFLDHLFICRGCALTGHRDRHKRGEKVLMLEYEQKEQRDHVMACKLQGLWRQKKSRERIRVMIRGCYQKQFDAASQSWYYCNIHTGTVHWHKPYNLGSEDLPDPPDRWEQLTDEAGAVYYFHALTGRYSKMSEDQAATNIQRLFRKSRSSDFKVKDLGVLAKAVRYQREAKNNYFKNPERLSSIVNYALLNHCIELDWDLAKELYSQARDRAPQNPLLLICYAVFQVAACVYPRQHTFDQAQTMLEEARVMDPEFEKFQVARGAFFHFAIVMSPHEAKTLLNWAVLKQCVERNYDAAEVFYRRALEMYDHDAADERFGRFWWNRVTGQTSWQEPDWDLLWAKRREGGVLQQRVGIWDQYEDAQGREFYFNFSTGVSQWEKPVSLAG